MKKKDEFKRVIAGVLAFALVAGVLPSGYADLIRTDDKVSALTEVSVEDDGDGDAALAPTAEEPKTEDTPELDVEFDPTPFIPSFEQMYNDNGFVESVSDYFKWNWKEDYSGASLKVDVAGLLSDSVYGKAFTAQFNQLITDATVRAMITANGLTIPATVTEEIIDQATCDEEGSKKYVASIGNKISTESQPIDIPATGQHNYGNLIWCIEEDGSITGEIACQNCLEHQEATIPANMLSMLARTLTDDNWDWSGDYSKATLHVDGSAIPAQALAIIDDATLKNRIAAEGITVPAVVTSAVTTKPTYEADGEETFTAAVGAGATALTDTRTKAIAKLVVTYTKVDEVAATCTTDGTKEYYNGSDDFRYLLVDGKYVKADDNDLIIPATGHSYGDPVWAPTADGSITVTATCSGCKDAKTKTFTAAEVQQLVTAATAAKLQNKWTWTPDNNTAYVTIKAAQPQMLEPILATYIDDEELRGKVAAKGITIPAVVTSDVTKEPTYEAEGERTYTAVAGTLTETKTVAIPKLEVQFTKVDAKEPTCTENGNSVYYTGSDGKFYVLSESGYEEIAEGSWVIKATGHEYGTPEWKANADGTMTVTVKCTENDDTKTATFTADQLKQITSAAAKIPLRMKWTWLPDYTAASVTIISIPSEILAPFTNDAKLAGKIAENGITIPAVVTSVVTKEPTYEAEGERTYNAVAGTLTDYRIAAIPKLEKVEAKEPTCTEPGNREYFIGSDGKFYVLSKSTDDDDDHERYTEIEENSWVIPANGHEYGDPVFIPNADGSVTVRISCENCDEVKTVNISEEMLTGIAAQAYRFPAELKTWNWAPDYSAATVTIRDDKNKTIEAALTKMFGDKALAEKLASNGITIPCEIEVDDSEAEPTYDSEGVTVYTATAGVLVDVKTVTVPKLEHPTLAQAEVSFADGDTFTQTGENITVSFSLTHNGKTLVEGEDFEFTEGDMTAKQPGTYMIKLVGIGEDFVGERTIPWYITPQAVTVTADGTVIEDVEFGKSLTVTAPEAPAGKKFSHWAVNGEPVCYTEDYSFIVKGSVDLKSVFVDKEAEVKAEPILSISTSQTVYNGKNAIGFEFSHTVPDNYTLEEAGILYATNKLAGADTTKAKYAAKVNLTKTDFDVEKAVKNQNADVKSFVADYKNHNGTISFSYGVGKNTDCFVYAVGYVKIKDEQGEIHTLTTNFIAVTYNTAE